MQGRCRGYLMIVLLLLLACPTSDPVPVDAPAVATRASPPLTTVNLPILSVQTPFRWDSEFRGLATAALEMGLYDLPGVVPKISEQFPSPSGRLGSVTRRMVDATFQVRGPPENLELELQLCVAGGSCETTTATCRRESPWDAFGTLLEGAALTLGLEVSDAQKAAWHQPGSRDNYAELLTGRSAAMYYGILPLPDPVPLGNAHPALRAVLVDPRQPLAQWIWARWQAGTVADAGKATESLARASLLRPESPLYLAERSWLLGLTGHPEEALLGWEELYKKRPDDPRIMEPYARALLTVGRADDAADVLARFPAEFRWDPAIAALQVQVAEAAEGTENLDPLLEHWQLTDSKAIEPVRRRIELRVQRRTYAEALPLVSVLRSRAPGPQTDALEVALLVAVGRLNDASALAPEEVAARLSLRGALEVDPGAEVGDAQNDPVALVVRASAALWRSEPAAALALLDQAQCPTCTEMPETWLVRAKALEKMGRGDEAVGAYRRAWELDPAAEGGPVQPGRIASTFRVKVRSLAPETPPVP